MSSVQHFRWPFCREYPSNPSLQKAPVYYDSIDPDTGVITKKKVYVSYYSTQTQQQKDADELLGRILKVSFGIMGLVGMVALGYYLGKKH